MSGWALIGIIVFAYFIGRAHGRASVARDARRMVDGLFKK